MTVKILPSLLAADLLTLGKELDAVIQAGADMIHLDVMDNHYVPNLSFGPAFCQAIRNHNATIPIDVHLMASPVDALIQTFAEQGANRISIHADATIHLNRSLQLIKDAGLQAGLALNPASPLHELDYCAHQLDFVLVMSVNPGFGGQSLIEAVIPKIKQLRAQYPKLTLAVDGGVDAHWAKHLIAAGANELIAGSAIFNQDDYTQAIAALRP